MLGLQHAVVIGIERVPAVLLSWSSQHVVYGLVLPKLLEHALNVSIQALAA